MPRYSIVKSRQLRASSTDAERLLWHSLRNRQVFGERFNRQYIIEPYIVDFCCRRLRFVIEVDGGQHDIQLDHDQKRTTYLVERGYSVIRFWNNEVMQNLPGVLDQVSARIELLQQRVNRPSL